MCDAGKSDVELNNKINELKYTEMTKIIIFM